MPQKMIRLIPKQADHGNVIVGLVGVAHIGSVVVHKRKKDIETRQHFATGWVVAILIFAEGQGTLKLIMVVIICVI